MLGVVEQCACQVVDAACNFLLGESLDIKRQEVPSDPRLDMDAAIDAAPQITQVQQTYIFEDSGILHVLGTEPGPVMAVAGGSGDFAGANGTLTFEGALGVALDPPFSAPDVAGVPVTFISARLTFSFSLGDADDDD